MNVETDDRFDRAARQLARDIRPERDLWAGIAEALVDGAEPARPARTPWLAQAAAVVLLVGASSGVTWYWMKDQSGPVTQVTPEFLFEQASFGGNYTLGADFQAARDGLVAELEVSLAQLSPEARSAVEDNLAFIHQAIFDLNAALETQPDNVLLQEKLLRAYREELALLRRVGGLTRNVMMRNDI